MSEQGVIVVSDLRIPPDVPGHYALVRARNWNSSIYPTVEIWKGPERRSETVHKKELRQVFCKTVAVDPDGFFVCVPLTGEERERVFFSSIEVPEEELAEMAIKEGEELVQGLANERTAEAWSYVSDDLNDDFNGEVWVKASSGDVTAVNGELVWGRKIEPPKNYILSDRGGRMPSGEEAEIDVDSLAEMVARELSAKIGVPIAHSKVYKIVKDHWGKNYILWTSDPGRTEVWISKRANQAYRRKLDREEKERVRRQEQEILVAKKQKVEERRAKIRRGGFPTILDWSPTGELPED